MKRGQTAGLRHRSARKLAFKLGARNRAIDAAAASELPDGPGSARSQPTASRMSDGIPTASAPSSPATMMGRGRRAAA